QAAWPAMTRGEPVIIDDVRGASELAQGYRRAVGDLFETALLHVHAFLAVPLIVQGRATGMLTVSHARAGYFTADHARLVRAIADQAAVAIENAQLLEETKARARETEALIRADEGLFRSLSLDAVFQALTDVVVDVLEVEKSLAMGPDESVGHYVVRSSRNMAAESVAIVEQLLAATEPLAQDARDDGTMPPIVIEDMRTADERLAPIVANEGIRSMMVIPVRSERELHGRFIVAYTATHPFSQGERRLMAALADRAAVAIENARLYERAQRAASLEERQRLARDLHDSVSQALYGIALGARTAQTMLQRNAGDVGEPLDYVLSLAEAGLAEMRALIFELRPDSLESEGLVVALEKQAAATRSRYRIDVQATLCGEPPASLVVKEALYRIAQEAMHNTVKHARTNRIELALTCTDREITLVLRDDGAGFDTSASFPGHMGLQSMQERASRVGGTLSIDSS
ncbi:MAG: GAF domain-containing protein, partial [Dehalococcoidia bacterium]